MIILAFCSAPLNDLLSSILVCRFTDLFVFDLNQWRYYSTVGPRSLCSLLTAVCFQNTKYLMVSSSQMSETWSFSKPYIIVNGLGGGWLNTENILILIIILCMKEMQQEKTNVIWYHEAEGIKWFGSLHFDSNIQNLLLFNDQIPCFW